MNAVKGIENKKWDFSKQEEAAVSWLLERGFEVKLEKAVYIKGCLYCRKRWRFR